MIKKFPALAGYKFLIMFATAHRSPTLIQKNVVHIVTLYLFKNNSNIIFLKLNLSRSLLLSSSPKMVAAFIIFLKTFLTCKVFKLESFKQIAQEKILA
jgi:hypothetical protein